MEGCFTNARFRCVQSFTFKCRQCSDIADYFAEIGPEFRFPVWESYLRDQTRGDAAGRRCEQAMMDFCRAVKDAELFLKDHCCTSASKNNWPLCAQGLTKLDTREAYDVHLQNLIWSKTSLEVAMLFAPTTSGGARGVMISSDDVQRLVADRRRVLCRYASSYKERQILLDRLDFNESIEGLINANNSGEDHKYLAFLLRKSQALQELRGGQRDNGVTDLINPFEISDSELNSGNEEELGRGGFAERVYSTLWLGQIRVAVKVIRLADSDFDIEAGELLALCYVNKYTQMFGHLYSFVFPFCERGILGIFLGMCLHYSALMVKSLLSLPHHVHAILSPSLFLTETLLGMI